MRHAEEKKSLRQEKLLLRKSLNAKQRTIADQRIAEHLLSLPELSKFEVLVAYATDGTEPDVKDIMLHFLESGRTVCLPRFGKSEYEIVKTGNLDLVTGKWGIPEPSPDAQSCEKGLLEKALWLIPGVAFDENGDRLGRGKGVYDRLLENGAGLSVGIFYECQKCRAIPREEHDRRLDLVVTECGVYRGISHRNNNEKGVYQ